VPHRMARWTRGLLLATSGLLAACDYPWWYFDRIDVNAEFRQDGSCSMSIDGKPRSEGKHTQAFYDNSTSADVVAKHMIGFAIDCLGPHVINDPHVSVLLAVPVGLTATTGTFEVVPFEPHLGKVAARVFVTDYELTRGFWNGITGTDLRVFEGTLKISAIVRVSHRAGGDAGPLVIVGSLSATARRKALPLIE